MINQRIQQVHQVLRLLACYYMANILQGSLRGHWILSARFFRSPTWTTRTINTITLGDNVFVLCEDTAAPSRNRLGGARPQGHYRSTYLTISPPAALQTLLHQLGGNWSNRLPGAFPDVDVNGVVYGVGDDVVIRIGKVMQRGEMKGMVIEVRGSRTLGCVELTEP